MERAILNEAPRIHLPAIQSSHGRPGAEGVNQPGREAVGEEQAVVRHLVGEILQPAEEHGSLDGEQAE